MIELIIFDWDGVFTLGSTEAYFKCYHEAIKSVGINLSKEEEKERILAKWGRTVEEEIRELLKDNLELVPRAVEKYEEILKGDTFVNHLTAVEGSQKLIEDLSTKYKLAIASGINPQLLKDKIFPKFGFPKVFLEIVTVYDIDDPSKAKPHPYMAIEIMKRLNISPENTILVGDAKGDVVMAKAAGITPVVVLTGHLSKKEAEELAVKYILKDVTGLEKIMEKF